MARSKVNPEGGVYSASYFQSIVEYARGGGGAVGEVVNCGKRPQDGASEGGGNDPEDAEAEHGRTLSFYSPCNRWYSPSVVK